MRNNEWNNGNNVWDNRTVGGTMENNDRNKEQWMKQKRTIRTIGIKGGTIRNNEWNNGNNVWNNRTLGGTMENNENKG